MKRIELYIDENDIISLDEYESLSSLDERISLKGAEAYRYLKEISSSSIRNVHELPNDEDVVLIHKDFILDIKNYELVFRKYKLSLLLNNIKKFYEHKELKKSKGRKVKRLNKHTNKKMAFAGLSLAIVSSCFLVGMTLIEASDVKTNSPSYSISISSAEFASGVESTNIDVIDAVNQISIPKDNDEILSFEEDSIPIFIDYGDNSQTEKAFKTQEYYGDIIKKYSDIYGLDYRLVTAIATQERGIHSEVMDSGGAIGLMQVQKSVWSNQKLTAYNFQTKENETIVVDPQKLSNLDYNIKVGCMIFQTVMRYFDYNILASIQGYNMGVGSVKKILNKYSLEVNKSIDEILQNQEDSEWLKYRNMISAGDKKYIEHVLSWMGPNIYIENIKKDGETVNLCINNQENTKKVY